MTVACLLLNVVQSAASNTPGNDALAGCIVSVEPTIVAALAFGAAPTAASVVRLDVPPEIWKFVPSYSRLRMLFAGICPVVIAAGDVAELKSIDRWCIHARGIARPIVPNETAVSHGMSSACPHYLPWDNSTICDGNHAFKQVSPIEIYLSK